MADTAVLVRLDSQGRAMVGELLRQEPTLRLEQLEAVVVAEGFVVLEPVQPRPEGDDTEAAVEPSIRVSMDARKRIAIPAGLRYWLSVQPGAQLLISADVETGGLRVCNLGAVVVSLELAAAAAAGAAADSPVDADPFQPAALVAVADQPATPDEGPLLGRTRRFR